MKSGGRVSSGLLVIGRDHGTKTLEHLSHCVARVERMSELDIGSDLVVVATTNAFNAEIARFLELVEDALYGPFGDADEPSNVALTQVGVAMESEQYVRVVGEERPRCSTRC